MDKAPLDPLVAAFIAHYQFEAIHPFGDGNGRVGRLLLSATIAEWCGLNRMWLYMSAYFERNRDRYMELMFRISTHGHWAEWVAFCLQGVVLQARDTIKRCERLISINRDFHGRLKKGSVRLSAVVDSLFDVPAVLVSHVRDKHNVTYPTAAADLRKLSELGILQPLPGVGQKAYFCKAIYDVSFEE
jgi:Fic family protein